MWKGDSGSKKMEDNEVQDEEEINNENNQEN